VDEARRPDVPALVLGATAEGATGNDVPVILRDTIGLHVKQVVGYPDSASIFLAIERGEVHGRTVDLSTVKSMKPEWLKPDGGFRVFVQFARARPGTRIFRTCRPGVTPRRTRRHAR